MSLLASTLFGLKENYNLYGINIKFDDQIDDYNVFGNTFFSKTTNFLLSNRIIKLITFGYLHVFIHEMGHAFAAKLCGNSKCYITVFTSTCRGTTFLPDNSNIFISIAGPILSIFWETAKLIAAIALIILLPLPIGLPLGIFLAAGSAFWLFGEMAYACSRNGDWDFLKR